FGHRQEDPDLGPAAARRCFPQSGGFGGCSHLRGRVHGGVSTLRDRSCCQPDQDRGLPGHLHRWSHLQRISGGLWQTS
ncbi:hypothetical protein M9458_042277, partial [Cirrhinus mrigala]